MLSTIHAFFACSELVDHEVLRPLSHILPNWELRWDADRNTYISEVKSFAALFICLVNELENTSPPSKYHDNEDALAELVQRNLNWGIEKQGRISVNRNGGRLAPDDYVVTMEQGAFGDADQRELVLAAAGRIRAAQDRGQLHYDCVEESHRRILAGVLC